MSIASRLAWSAAFVLGCDSPSTGSPPIHLDPVTPPAVSTAASPMGAPATAPPARAGRAPGPLGALFVAARGVELSEAARETVSKLEQGLRPEEGAATQTFAELHTALTNAIRGGKINPTALAALYAALEKEAEARRDVEERTATALHLALDPDQRRAVATAVRAEQGKLVSRARARSQGASPTEEDRTKKGLDRATQALDLLPAQQKRLQPALARYEQAKSEPPPPDAWLVVFETDALEVKKLLPGSPAAARAELERQVAMLGELLAVLKPEQREKLAVAMERSKGPVHRPGGVMLHLPIDETRPFPRRP